MKQHLHSATSVVLQEAENRSEAGAGGGQGGETSPRARERRYKSVCRRGRGRPASGSSRAPPPGGLGVTIVTLVFPRPRSRGPRCPFGPRPAGRAQAQPTAASGNRPSPRLRPPGPPGPPEPCPGWHTPGWMSALARCPCPHRCATRTCAAHTGHRGAGPAPLQFWPKATAPPTSWSTSPGEARGLELGRLWPPWP